MDDSAPKPADEDAPAASDKSQLLEAFDGVVNREREKAVQSRSLPMARRTHTAVLVLCIVAWGTLAYVWLAKPDWLFPPDPASQLSPAERESRLRFGMFLERERVLDFRATHGRLPANLAEAGDVEEGIDYTATGESTFVVSATVRDSVLTLNESERADELLKQAGVAPSRPR